ncbi:MAG: hypothetical protein ABJ201_21935, partial [Nisaea sp.]
LPPRHHLPLALCLLPQATYPPDHPLRIFASVSLVHAFVLPDMAQRHVAPAHLVIMEVFAGSRRGSVEADTLLSSVGAEVRP